MTGLVIISLIVYPSCSLNRKLRPWTIKDEPGHAIVIVASPLYATDARAIRRDLVRRRAGNAKNLA